jgi:hypothetical protein
VKSADTVGGRTHVFLLSIFYQCLPFEVKRKEVASEKYSKQRLSILQVGALTVLITRKRRAEDPASYCAQQC